jgi:uncharacterized protein involved in exopolysaccharide biosynthesis
VTENKRTGKKQGLRKVGVGWVLGSALLFGFLSYLYTRSLPDIYCSEAILRVSVQTPAAGQFSSSDIELVRQIPSLIWREVLTDARLQDLGTKRDFYPGLRSGAASGDLVRQMKKDIGIKSRGNRMVRISCQSTDPNLAESLGGLVVSALVNGQNGDKSRILESQIKEVESKLQALNKQISDLDLQVGGSPGKQNRAYFSDMRQVIQKLQANVNHLSRLEVEKASKERTLAKRQKEEKAAGTSRDATTSELSKQIARLDQQLEVAKQEQDGLRSWLAQYQKKIDLLSQSEKKHKLLLDEDEVVRRQYQQLLATRTQLESTEAQGGLKGPTLRVVVPPSLPERRSKPNRTMLNLVGTLIGAVLGLGFSLLLRPRKSKEGGAENLIRVAGLPVLARIPLIKEPLESEVNGTSRKPGHVDAESFDQFVQFVDKLRNLSKQRESS